MSLATAPTQQQVPVEQYQRVCKRLNECEQKLSAVAAVLQDPTLTWKQKGAGIAVVLALEAQRPADNPNGAFRPNLGALAKRSGAIPPTPEGDEDASLSTVC